MQAPERLRPTDGREIAYHRSPASGSGASRPGIVFLGGFASDMTGTKAVYLEEWAKARGRAFLRFDYTGHGASSGRFTDGCIGDWFQDARDAVTALTEGPQVLVGSSMGGWIALLLARALPTHVAGLVGIAAAPDFTEMLMWPSMGPDEREAMARDGWIEQPSDYGDPLVITRRLIDDGRTQRVLDQPLKLPCPVRLLQGTADPDVPVWLAETLMRHLEAPQVLLTLIQNGDHRLSDDRSLSLITDTVDAIA